jgi:hypothetical protein
MGPQNSKELCVDFYTHSGANSTESNLLYTLNYTGN